jgi:solute carrier family 25 citrate transporter 1
VRNHFNSDTSQYPFEFAKTRVQLREQKGVPTPKNPFLVVANVYKQEGLGALYKGCSTLAIGSVAKDGIRFLSFDYIKEKFKDPETDTHAVATVWKEHGILGLYRGFAGTTLKQAGATAFRMGTYNILKDYERKKNIPQTVATNFANGCVAGIVTTLATQPFDTIKTRCQSSQGASTVEAFKSIVSDYGFKGFWRGTSMRLGRTVFSGGILFTSYEWCVRILNPTFMKVKEKVVEV